MMPRCHQRCSSFMAPIVPDGALALSFRWDRMAANRRSSQTRRVRQALKLVGARARSTQGEEMIEFTGAVVDRDDLTQAGEPARILVIEDDQDTADLLHDLLAESGYQVYV